MIITNAQHINFPLQQLLERLERQAGFEFTPADILRTQRLLQEKSTLLLTPQGRVDLQYFLAPLLCKSQEEQQQFYQVYQDYLTVDLVVEKMPTTAKYNWKLIAEYLLIALWFFTLCWEWHRQLTMTPSVKPDIQFIYPKEKVTVGDTIVIENTSNLIDDPTIIFRWDYEDLTTGQIITQQTTPHFNFVIPSAKKDYQKKIRLSAIDTTTQQVVGMDSTTLLVGCQNPPQVDAISVLDTLFTPFHPLSFSVAVEPEEGVTYEWEFGDGGKEFVANPTHIYQQSGYYQLKVTVSDTSGVDGECTRQVQTEIEIQGAQKQAYIPLLTFDLQKEPPLISNPLRNWALFLLLTFLLTALWAWWKWWNRPFPERVPKNNFIVSRTKKTLVTLEEQVQPTELQFNLATQLRLRQAGTQQVVDVIPTVHQTIEKGGFPNVQFKNKKEPTEYLVLLPELKESTIAVQLFAYLVSFFQEQDVLIDLFYYQDDWGKVWNEKHPNGMLLEKLYQYFPTHRLILYLPTIADKTGSDGIQEKLLKEKTLQNWFKKVALQAPTSFPLSNDLLPVYPANLVGIQAAIHRLNQSAAAAEITGTFNTLKKIIPLTNNSLSITDYETQLAHRPDIYRWFKALVIHPQPTIDSMLAVGEALDLSLDYDSLLMLSSLPNFQAGKFDRTIWTSIWETFSTAEERKVRSALKASLMTKVEASTEKTDNPLNKLIAIQNFGINPKEVDHQEQIRYLLKKQQFSNVQLEELDIIVTRHIDNYRPGQAIGETIANYLADVEAVAPVANRPWSTFYFWLATILSVLGLTFGGLLYSLPNGIHRMTIEQPKSEAAEWNNRAVDQYRSPEKDTVLQTGLITNYQGFSAVSRHTAHYLAKSRRVDSTFEKAITNFQKLQYNDGVAYYEQFFKEQGEQLELAKQQFKLVITDTVSVEDSIQLAALFALAKIYNLLNEPDSVCAMITALTAASDLTFLGNTPFLTQQVDYCATNPTKIYITGKVVDASNNRSLKNVAISGPNFQTLSNQHGLFQGAIILSKTEKEIALNFSLANFQTIRRIFSITSDSLKLRQISLKLLPPEPIASTKRTQNRSAVLKTFEFPLPETILIPGGKFLMGCTDIPNDYCKPNEGPVHEVFLDSFEIGIYEVTNEEFAVFVNDYGINEIKEGKYAGKKLATPAAQGLYQKEDKTWAPNKGYEKHPIISVPRASAVAYCRWLSQKTGQIWRLPTEAEWEYAAKGGQKGKNNNYIYAGGNDLEEVAWCYLNSYTKGSQHPDYGTHPVGQKRPNALGLYDMSGNVFEWCVDWYQPDFYEFSKGEKAINPVCQRSGERRILRGGSWYSYREQDCRIANRFAVKHPSGGIETGFRCVRVLAADE